ncbi:MAG: aminotransferase class I/II-fold pyridoxal phosphate-dependent enzyme [Cyclobacteriaceae bacterium]
MQTANRLKTVQEYYFSKKLREIRELEAEGKEIINLGIGSPDLPPSPSVINALRNYPEQTGMHQYQSYQGIPDLRRAIADFYQQKFDVELDEMSGVLPLMGSKEGINHISMAYLNPGDQVLVPSLGYPTYTSVTRMAEAEPIYYPLDPHNNWEPDWDFFKTVDFSRIKIIWINYPHMPTGTKGNLDVLQQFVTMALENDILLVNDNPYSFILNDEPVSVLSVEGAGKVALELNSMSKTFNMAGWRIGWVCGDQQLLDPVLRIKSNMDSGMFKPLQLAAIEALKSGDDWYRQLNSVYKERRKVAQQLLKSLNCTIAAEQVGMFVWARCSSGTADELVDRVLYDHGVFITPGHIFGKQGKSFVRVSLCSPVEVFERARQRIS